jgi:predicted RNase H-like nuclease (RuvC/YqgF family)
MLQSKEEIIKMMSNQSEENSRKIIESKDRALVQLRKELEEQQRRVEQLKAEGAELQEKLQVNER